MDIDKLISAATAAAASLEIAPATEPAEVAHVVPALVREFQTLGVSAVAKGVNVPGWKPSPGPTDLVLGSTEPYAAVIEVKVWELGWSLWDMVKVASLVAGGKAAAGYLVVVAKPAKFEQPGGFGAMLDNHPRIDTEILFMTYGRDWLDLLRGGSGRPVELAAWMETRLAAQEPLTNVPGWEIRAVKVIPDATETVRFVNESWPVGHPRLASGLN